MEGVKACRFVYPLHLAPLRLAWKSATQGSASPRWSLEGLFASPGSKRRRGTYLRPCEIPIRRSLSPPCCRACLRHRRKKLTAHVALPSRFTVIRQLTLPAVGEKELQSAIDIQIQHNIHLPFDEAAYDYVLCDPPADEEGMISILLVAADKSRVNDVIQGFRSVGMRPKTIDIHALALYRLIRRFRPDLPHNFLLLETSEDTVDVHVFHNGLLYLTRQVLKSQVVV